MSQFTVNPADERSIQILVTERQDRVREAARRDISGDHGLLRGAIRRAVGQWLIRLGERLSRVPAPRLPQTIDAA